MSRYIKNLFGSRKKTQDKAITVKETVIEDPDTSMRGYRKGSNINKPERPSKKKKSRRRMYAKSRIANRVN